MEEEEEEVKKHNIWPMSGFPTQNLTVGPDIITRWTQLPPPPPPPPGVWSGLFSTAKLPVPFQPFYPLDLSLLDWDTTGHLQFRWCLDQFKGHVGSPAPSQSTPVELHQR